MVKVNVKLLTVCTLVLLVVLFFHSIATLQRPSLQSFPGYKTINGIEDEESRYEVDTDTVDFKYGVNKGNASNASEKEYLMRRLKKNNSFISEPRLGMVGDQKDDSSSDMSAEIVPTAHFNQQATTDNPGGASNNSDRNTSRLIDNTNANEPMCKQIINICYIKVHKSSSSTVSNIFQRFGYTQNLTFVLPNKLVNIGYPSGFKGGLPKPKSRSEFNLLVNHAVFHEENMRDVMPADTVFVGSFRHPFSHLLSSYNFFNLEQLNDMPDVRTFLSDPATYDNSRSTGMSFTRGYQAWHYGYNPLSHSQQSLIDLIERLDKTFSIILISEYLNMSLLLMKRLLCWNLKDILYVSKKIASYPNKYADYKESDVKRYEKWNTIDYILYDHYNQSLWSKITQQGKSFFDELNNYETLLQRISVVCNESVYEFREPSTQTILYDVKTDVSLTIDDCILMLTSSQDYVRVLKNKQYTKSEILRYHGEQRANEIFKYRNILPDFNTL
ncbi:unnamed protein product [Owenia fusiformis]|uniref:Uncharacterized protein n=1 Tax=Owenia fusiformis TaxID=6347 RepID=A0A8J1TGZ1_OWEFU|nr:unnamed protein product [Owenia fusiformis]